MQLERQELPAELPANLAREYVKQAMAGKSVLLCIDDVWSVVASMFVGSYGALDNPNISTCFYMFVQVRG